MIRVVLVPWFSSVLSVDALIFHRGGGVGGPPLFFVGCVVDVTVAAGCDRFWCRVRGDGCLFCSLTVVCCICERFGGSWSE